MRGVLSLLVSTLAAVGQPTTAPLGFEVRAAAQQPGLMKRLEGMFQRAQAVIDAAAATRTPPRRREMLKRFGQPNPPRHLTLHALPPYALFLETSTATRHTRSARRIADALKGHRRAFAALTGKHRLPRDTRPLTFVVLRDRGAYLRYLAGLTGAAPETDTFSSHAELDGLRVVVHHDTDAATLRHEATHLLLAAHRTVRGALHARPLWFEEGLAEWLSTVRTLSGSEQGTAWGGLNPLNLSRIARSWDADSGLSIRQLLDATVATRDDWLSRGLPQRVRLAYAQGWALFHFLQHFDVDDNGRVRFGAGGTLGVGRYRQGFNRFVAWQLDGKDGRPHGSRQAFMEALAVDGAGLSRLEGEYRAWVRWLRSKSRRGAVRNGRVIAASHHKDARGAPAGRPEDDLLFR